jgi:hypothetical protein
MLFIIYTLLTKCTSVFMMYFIHYILTNMLWLQWLPKHVGDNIVNEIQNKNLRAFC